MFNDCSVYVALAGPRRWASYNWLSGATPESIVAELGSPTFVLTKSGVDYVDDDGRVVLAASLYPGRVRKLTEAGKMRLLGGA